MTDSVATAPLPACRHLVIAGLPGSGTSTLQERLCGILETDRVPWSGLSMMDFHTPHACAEIRNGNLLRTPDYWVRLYRQMERYLTLLEKCHVHMVLTGTFLTRNLRQRFLQMRPDMYLVWLKVSPEKAKERISLAHNLEGGHLFRPEWIDTYMTTTEFPQAIESARSGRRLLRSDEERVYILDADDERLGHKTNFVCNGVPGLRDSRVRVSPKKR